MTITINAQGAERKRLVQTVSNWLGVPAKYCGAPTFAYEIDCFTVEKDGSLSFSDLLDSEVVERLLQHIYDEGFDIDQSHTEDELAAFAFLCRGACSPTAMNTATVRSVTVIPPTINPLTHISMAATRKRRVAGYARVSTDSDEQFTSYEAQIDYYTQYIQRNPEWKFVKVYTDEGISGTSTKHRTGFNEMIDDAMSGKMEIKTAELIQFDFSGAAKF